MFQGGVLRRKEAQAPALRCRDRTLRCLQGKADGTRGDAAGERSGLV